MLRNFLIKMVELRGRINFLKKQNKSYESICILTAETKAAKKQIFISLDKAEAFTEYTAKILYDTREIDLYAIGGMIWESKSNGGKQCVSVTDRYGLSSQSWK